MTATAPCVSVGVLWRDHPEAMACAVAIVRRRCEVTDVSPDGAVR